MLKVVDCVVDGWMSAKFECDWLNLKDGEMNFDLKAVDSGGWL